LRREFYEHLGPWQARANRRGNPQRPYTLDFIGLLFTDFFEMHGDRGYGDDKAIVAGLAKFHGRPVAVIGHQKGRDTKPAAGAQFRPAEAGGLSKSAARDEIGSEVWPPDLYIYRHAGRLPRPWTRKSAVKPKRLRLKPAGDGAPAGADRRYRNRRKAAQAAH